MKGRNDSPVPDSRVLFGSLGRHPSAGTRRRGKGLSLNGSVGVEQTQCCPNTYPSFCARRVHIIRVGPIVGAGHLIRRPGQHTRQNPGPHRKASPRPYHRNHKLLQLYDVHQISNGIRSRRGLA